MNLSGLSIPLMLMLADWTAVVKSWRRLEYLTKPGTLIALLFWMWSAVPAGPGRPLLWNWFLLAVFFSLCGDIFLMLPREQFLAGLVAFLAAHVAYIIGLNGSPPPLSPASFLVVIGIAITGFRLYRHIAGGLERQHRHRLRFPVLLYALAISTMLVFALLTLVRPNTEWRPAAALIVSAGATSFYISDTLLAWDRFVRPVSSAKLLVRVSYHLGQLGLVLGAGLHILF